jgi:hypothetical protein
MEIIVNFHHLYKNKKIVNIFLANKCQELKTINFRPSKFKILALGKIKNINNDLKEYVCIYLNFFFYLLLVIFFRDFTSTHLYIYIYIYIFFVDLSSSGILPSFSSMETTRRLNRPTPDRLLVVQPPEEVAQVCRQEGAQLVHALVRAPANDGGPAELLYLFS